jgi:hypothetical protein
MVSGGGFPVMTDEWDAQPGHQIVETNPAPGDTWRKWSARHVDAVESGLNAAKPNGGPLSGIVHHHQSGGVDRPFETTWASGWTVDQFIAAHVAALTNWLLAYHADMPS